jgi:hypothetical protein
MFFVYNVTWQDMFNKNGHVIVEIASIFVLYHQLAAGLISLSSNVKHGLGPFGICPIS